MKVALIVAGFFILSVVAFFACRVLIVNWQSRKINRYRWERVRPLYEKLESGQELTSWDVLPYARNLLTRETAFHLLKEHGKAGLFPKEYLNIVKGAESNLVNWLEFPTELDACPDEIEYVKRVTLVDVKGTFVHYEVFKYRVNEPHWAAGDGWMLGVVGPYFDDSKPYDFPHATFSRISSTNNKVSPDEEAKWVHEHISLRS
ncbi:hypothetical protein V9K67_10335 [Paraflavisolibacter sp. H34]|uniref:hypothetical protein n=1 Tax=Huijunlia imazamoxiresistens TaxID=3127457 RepID=UPI003019661E